MNKYSLPAILALTMIPAFGNAQSEPKCLCTPYPFSPDPPCFEICAARLINASSIDELLAVLDLPAETQSEILVVKQSATLPTSLDEWYSEDAKKALSAAFDEANQDELQGYLNRMFTE